MARTVDDAVTEVRKAVTDPSARRDSDAEIRRYLVDGLNIIKSQRPDLFLGAYGTTYETLAQGAALPTAISGQFFLSLVMYGVARVEFKDEESADRARGELALKLAGGLL
ncbi:hypothetical protein [Ramlibacter sp.]|uniref:hypothetical protein n=1 Tax=Ramlibacter sp. TaxID=1917967 RepID=UPI003D10134F